MSTLASASSKIDADFAAEVRAGLTHPGQKELPSKYFYNDLGSALFEAITLLPEYGLTRADARLLESHAWEIVDRAGIPVFVAELGSGTGQKTRHILKALQLRQPMTRYYPIDVSRAALEMCGRDLGAAAEVYPLLDTYIPGIARAASTRLPNERMLVLFLGSTIGNFERGPAGRFLVDLRNQLMPRDRLLIGADLVKPVEQLLAAYDDPTGVTAAFNLNVLARVNRQLGANFDLRGFAHEARYNVPQQRVEMHLRSIKKQKIEIPGADCVVEFAAGETIWTESSHKYHLDELENMAAASGFRLEAQWVDQEWPFVESLWTAR